MWMGMLHVVRLPLVPQLADGIRAIDLKEKSLCAMSRSSLFKNTAFGYK